MRGLEQESLNLSLFVAVQKLNRKLRISDPILNRTRDPRRSSAMSSVSHLHQLFHPETCQSYIAAPEKFESK